MTTKVSDGRFDADHAQHEFVENLVRLDIGVSEVFPNEDKRISAAFPCMGCAQEFLSLVSKHTARQIMNTDVSRAERRSWKLFGKRIGGLTRDRWLLNISPNSGAAESYGAKRLAKWLRKFSVFEHCGLCVTFPYSDLSLVNECLDAFQSENGEDEITEREDDETDDCHGDAALRQDSGERAGTMWARHDADGEQLGRLTHWHGQMQAASYGDFDAMIDGATAYCPAEQVYFTIHPEDEGDRTAARHFWQGFFEGIDAGPLGNVDFVKGFIEGAMIVARTA
ncbi:MAG: hypothetical protein ACJ8C4_09635 [Gemmataceae bacterium]